MLRTKTPGCMASLMPHSESSWLAISVQSMPAAMRRSRYSSIFSGATSKATWFMEPMALVRSPWSGRAAGALMPGTPSGASGNQKKARQSPPPQSKKKCWPMPAGSSIVLTSGMPRTFV